MSSIFTLRPARTVVRFSRSDLTIRNTSRHEAGHILVALTLDLNLTEAVVFSLPDIHGVAGKISIDHTGTIGGSLSDVRSRLIRCAAVCLAGSIVELKQSATTIAWNIQGTDVCQADTYISLAAGIWEAPVHLRSALAVALCEDTGISAWQQAISEASYRLARSPSAVPADFFKAIAIRHTLSMPRTVALADAAQRSNSP